MKRAHDSGESDDQIMGNLMQYIRERHMINVHIGLLVEGSKGPTKMGK